MGSVSDSLAAINATTNTIASVAGVLSGISTASDSEKLAKKQLEQQESQFKRGMQFNSEEAEKVRKFNAEQAELNRQYLSEQEVMKRRAAAGLNSAILGESGASGGSTAASSGSSATSPAPGAPAGSLQPLNPGLFGNMRESLQQLLQTVDALSDPSSEKSILGPEFALSSAQVKSALGSALSNEATARNMEALSKQNEARAAFSYDMLSAELKKMASDAVSSSFNARLAELNNYNVSQQIETSVISNYFQFRRDNREQFRAFLDGASFDLEFKKVQSDLKLRVNDFIRAYNNDAFEHGKKFESQSVKSQRDQILSRYNKESNWDINARLHGGYSLGTSASVGGSYTGVAGAGLASINGNVGINGSVDLSGEISDGHSLSTQIGYDNTSASELSTSGNTSEQFVNSLYGFYAINMTGLWDIVNDDTADLKLRRRAANDMISTLSSWNAYMMFLRDVRSSLPPVINSLQGTNGTPLIQSEGAPF